MPFDPVAHEQLLLSLDQRQDDVLERLEELDQQIEALIRVWTQQRSVGGESQENEAEIEAQTDQPEHTLSIGNSQDQPLARPEPQSEPKAA